MVQMLKQETPTFIVVVDDSYRVTLDHVVMRESDVQDRRVVVNSFKVPDLSSDEYSKIVYSCYWLSYQSSLLLPNTLYTVPLII